VRTIPLGNTGLVARVSDDKYESVMAHGPWYRHLSKSKYSERMYAARHWTDSEGSHTQLLHNFVTGQKRIDHLDHDGLNNQDDNLVPKGQSRNLRNANKRGGNVTSRFKGVDWREEKQRWRARITLPGHTVHLGYFTDEEAAAFYYDAAAIRYFGSDALLNCTLFSREFDDLDDE
jgi:AP2 domain